MASRGLREMDDGVAPVADPIERRLLRAVGNQVTRISAATAIVAAGLLVLAGR